MTGFSAAIKQATLRNIEVDRPTCRRFEVGDVVYALQWQETTPRLVAREVVAVDDKAIVVRAKGGELTRIGRCAPAQGAYFDPREAIYAEMQWLRWFMPHEAACDRAAAERRAKQMAELITLWESLRVDRKPAFVAA